MKMWIEVNHAMRMKKWSNGEYNALHIKITKYDQ